MKRWRGWGERLIEIVSRNLGVNCYCFPEFKHQKLSSTASKRGGFIVFKISTQQRADIDVRENFS